jgi:opacity protein-like surface antigen
MHVIFSGMYRPCALLLSAVSIMILPAVGQAQDTTIQEERAREAERVREAERTREEAERTRELQRTREAERIRAEERARVYEDERARAYRDRRDHHEPGELYVAGFGGYTFTHGFNNVQGTGLFAGGNFNDFGLKNSVVYGAKVGYFLPNDWNWLGFEVEGFNTTPHFEQVGPIPGANLRVTTAAFNVIGRLKMGCTHDDRYDRYDRDRPRRVSTDYDSGYGDRGFCRIQPYAGVGIGIFFAERSNGTSSSDNAVPGLNALAGLRFYLTEHIAVFGEYKYNRATFEFDNAFGPGAGFKGDYSVSNVVGGLSFHF